MERQPFKELFGASSAPAATLTTNSTSPGNSASSPLSGDPTASPSGTAVAGSTTTARQVAAASVVGTWEGVYRCGVLRGLRLGITSAPEGKGEGALLATFTFYEEGGNAGTPLGVYAMKGSYASGTLVLDPDYWIKSAGSFYMIGLRGKLDLSSSPVKLTGAGTTGCEKFELRKVSDTAEPPPL